jgi:hypothetical protein
MKKTFFVLVMTVLAVVGIYSQTDTTQNPQWDFFKNVIPKHKNIKISAGDWTMTIDDKYKVSFSCDIRSESESFTGISSGYLEVYGTTGSRKNVTFSGVGFVAWDNEKMKIEIPITGYGSYTFRSGSKDRQGFFTSVKDSNASGNSLFNCTFDLIAEYVQGSFSGKLKLIGKTLTLNMTGETSSSQSITIGSNSWFTANLVPKTESEMNASSKDAFGEWSWNEDRSKIFLKSKMRDNKFLICNIDGTVSWSMEIGKNVKGTSESTTETNERLINLAMSFDGAPAQVFSFIENKDATPGSNFIQLDYGVYNRFLGTLDKNSDAILSQIKDKSMMILQYKDGGMDKSDMFLLEGLETIMEYLKQ